MIVIATPGVSKCQVKLQCDSNLNPSPHREHYRWASPPAVEHGCWTDRMQVLCQCSSRPGARPPWCVASRPGRQATRSEGGAYQDPTGRW